jgi:hypothetical protein
MRSNLIPCALAGAALTFIALGAAQPACAQGWGSVEGQFVFDGEVPSLKPLVEKGDANAKDAAVCAADGVPDQTIIVNPDNKGIANICVYMRKAPTKIHPDLAAPAESEVVFDQKGCMFLPHVLVVNTKQTVLVKSDDPVNHNTRTSPFSNEAINLIIRPNERDGVPVKMPQSELRTPPVKVSCDIHPWMSAYWLVTDHPYVAVTDGDGRFKIENLPAGKHQFVVWQEKAGYVAGFVEDTDAVNRVQPSDPKRPVQMIEVTIADGETVTIGPVMIAADAFQK